MDTKDNEKKRKKKFLRDHVYSGIKNSIITGEFEPRKRLIEETLAEAMEASRTPVREAFRKLEEEGLVYRRQRGGYAVKGLDEEEVDEIFGLRSILEGYAGFLAASRITREELKRLKEIVRQQEACLKEMHPAKFIELDTQFHDVLHAAAKNRRLYALLQSLKDHMYRYRIIILRYHPKAGVAVEDHKRIVQGLDARKARQVEGLIRKHMSRGENLIKRKLRQVI
jgi:DNA-binding GntR family transcriptional regulator